MKHIQKDDLRTIFKSQDKLYDAINYAKKNISIDGVAPILEEMEKYYADSIQKINTFIDSNQPTLDEKYEHYEKAYKKAKLCTIIIIITFILFIISGILSNVMDSFSPAYRLVDSLGILDLFALLASIVGRIVFGISAKSRSHKYRSLASVIGNNGNNLKAEHQKKASKYYTEIDNLYLASLDPTHREIVLMRRQQARQNQQQMAEQRIHQQKMEEEQRKIRQTQQELLEIERRREQRENKRYY